MTSKLSTVAFSVLVACAGSAVAGPAEDLLGANKCGKCHTARTTPKGPAYAAIAQKYKGQSDASAKIVQFLKTGGASDHDKLLASEADLKAVAALVLASK